VRPFDRPAPSHQPSPKQARGEKMQETICGERDDTCRMTGKIMVPILLVILAIGSVQFLTDDAAGERIESDSATDPDISMGGGHSTAMFITITAACTLSFLISLILQYQYARRKESELMDNANRKRLFEIIKERSGIHFSELQRELDLKQGVLSYHLNILEKNELIRSVQDGIYRRFYLYDEKIGPEFRLHEMQRKIIYIVQQRPGITQTKISRRLGRSKIVINYHLRILIEVGILLMEREGRETHCYIIDNGYNLAAV